jgi:hypothetical protein
MKNNRPQFSFVSFFQVISFSFVVLLLSTAHAQNLPFVIKGDDGTESITNFSRLIPAPVNDQFVTVKDGHFFVGEKRLRFWGVNLCFGANFPTHEEAKKIAPHFAKLGINAVRFHHMDNQDAPEGIWKTLPNGKRILDPKQIDKLDFFLNELHEQGIYANINLHVSRRLKESEGFPEMKGGPWWAASNKWTTYYDPGVQSELKKYCKDLMTHKNPYRNLRRSDDPGIGLVEMLNENYFSKKGTELLEHLPQQYVDSFRQAWNEWLAKKYKSTNAMTAAWSKEQTKLGASLISNHNWKDTMGPWSFNLNGLDYKPTFGHAGPKELGDNAKAIRFEAPAKSDQAHFQQLTHRTISVKAGTAYTFSFWVRADKSREFNLEISTTAGGEWRPVGAFETTTAGPEWRQVRKVIFPEETIDKEAYIAFSIGVDKTPIEFANVRLNEGTKATRLPADQSLEKGNIGVPESGWALAAHEDLKQFMIDTERAWIVELKRYLKEDLGVRVPITASQENYHADGILAETVDFVDLHNYWHHPTFPAGKDFNPTEYRTGNEPIESFPTRSSWPTNSLLMRTGWRYHGMPFTLSEWNHAEPSDVNTGAVMMAATLGSIQDWDGIFFFDYASNSKRWFSDHYEGFFDFNSQPAKLATFAVASNIFLRGDLSALATTKSGTFTDRLDGRLTFSHKIGVSPSAQEKDTVEVPTELKYSTPSESLTWDATDESKANMTINTPLTQGAWGVIAGQTFELPNLKLKIGNVDRDYATLVATSQDALPLSQSKSILLLASSGAENTNMQWNADRTSVSNQWGTGPTTINPVTATIQFESDNKENLKVYSLDGTGKRTSTVPATQTPTGIEFKIGAKYSTLWYEIARE